MASCATINQGKKQHDATTGSFINNQMGLLFAVFLLDFFFMLSFFGLAKCLHLNG
jgi:hypothetical protein